MNPSELQKARELVENGSSFLITGHRRPDADALGSAFGLASAFVAAGKRVIVYLPDPIPANLNFLIDFSLVKTEFDPAWRFDGTFLTDTATQKLLPRGFPSREQSGPLVVLDHHFIHDQFGDVVLRDVDAAATSIVALRLIEALDIKYLTKFGANALYTALCSDTGTFRYSTTDSAVLRTAATLVDYGADPEAVAQALYENWPWARVGLLSSALNAIELVCNGKVAIMTMTRAMLTEANAHDDMVEGFVNYTRRIEGVDLGVLLWEWPRTDGSIGTRVSFRSSGAMDASQIAVAMGGGGHRRAAATELDVSLAQARKLLEAELKKTLDHRPI